MVFGFVNVEKADLICKREVFNQNLYAKVVLIFFFFNLSVCVCVCTCIHVCACECLWVLFHSKPQKWFLKQNQKNTKSKGNKDPTTDLSKPIKEKRKKT